MIHYDSLLKNATDIITKCNSYFITKCDRSLLKNALGFLLQNATVLLRNATVITNCDNFITKLLKKEKNFMTPFYGWGSTVSRLEPLQGGSLYFLTVSSQKLYSFYRPHKDEGLSQP